MTEEREWMGRMGGCEKEQKEDVEAAGFAVAIAIAAQPGSSGRAKLTGCGPLTATTAGKPKFALSRGSRPRAKKRGTSKSKSKAKGTDTR